VSLGNCAEFAALTYAIFKLGAILVPLNPGFNVKQVTAALNHLGVELLVIGAVTDLAYKPCRGRSNLPLLQTIVPDLESGRVEAPEIPTLKTVVVVDNAASHPLSCFPALSSLRSLTSFKSLLPDLGDLRGSSSVASRQIIPDSPISASETINIQFTSGTTSQPKAAMLSHTNILNNGFFIAHRMGLEPSDLIVCPPPLFHCFGSVLGYMATATTGAAILFPSPAFDPLATLRMAAEHKATGLYGVATMFVAMLELLHPSTVPEEHIRAFPTHLRKGIAAGSSVPESLLRKLYDTLGLSGLVICYGMTETSPVSCMTSPDDPFAKRTASVGKAMPHTKVKVVDPDDRSRVVPIGQRGELAAAGYLVMRGYWGDEERTGEVRTVEKDEDGNEVVWLYSGDEASMDEQGYVEITGRIKDLIIRGGENIRPLEIENCLFQHPLVAEVSVVGVPDERYGESVGAFVIAHEGVKVEGEELARDQPGNAELLTRESVREWVRTHLSNHLAPKHVWFVHEYPKTASGKIQKFKLRDMATALVKAGK
jgi:acyl-CoA synthetase (AMP-forming)/AMP-acid ligase II